jgi:hypothetical protein
MNLFVLFGDRVITRKKKYGNFASCATRNDAVFRHFFFFWRVILHHQTEKNEFLKSYLLKKFCHLRVRETVTPPSYFE